MDKYFSNTILREIKLLISSNISSLVHACPGQAASLSQTHTHSHIHVFRVTSQPNVHLSGIGEEAREPGESSHTQAREEHAN